MKSFGERILWIYEHSGNRAQHTSASLPDNVWNNWLMIQKVALFRFTRIIYLIL